MALTNRLSVETSPYLRQHADNPVAWQPWDAESLALARDSGKPILLSIGYSACHWCHVMAHESFEDEEVAAVMNRLFINIKVDREERPDLDQIYQSAHQLLTGRPGGWPLTLFLTADGTPFYGGTYFPRTPRHGLPGFADLCERVAAAHTDRRDDIESQNAELRQVLAGAVPRGLTFDGPFDEQPLAHAREQLMRNLDRINGGFGGAPKFPHPTDLALLLTSEYPEQRQAALFSLTRMAEGGLYDQLGGGFCRYSVDAHWEIPHFEKMLYDNALLLGLYADAWALSGDPLYRRVVEDTAEWTIREMEAPEGGYWSALDADSEGEEGRFYLWDRQAIRALLTPEQWAVAAPHWGLDETPNFEGRWHLKVARPLAEADRPLLDEARRALLAARERRVRPGLDDKVLVAWNGLMIAAMAHAGRVFARPDWVASAERALTVVRGRPRPFLDDHAFLLAALLELLQARYRAEDMALAIEVADALLTRFEDAEGGGFFFTAHDHEALIQRPKPGHDNATPAGNGIAAFALQRLGHLLGDRRYLAAAERCLRLFWPELQDNPMGFGSLLAALKEAAVPPDIIILRGPETGMPEWIKALGASPARLSIALPNGLSGLSPALDKPESPHVNAWVCRGVTCLAPVDSLADLAGMLGEPLIYK